jgi:dTDP-4-dehydrorhamnose 3,5-epimerase
MWREVTTLASRPGAGRDGQGGRRDDLTLDSCMGTGMLYDGRRATQRGMGVPAPSSNEPEQRATRRPASADLERRMIFMEAPLRGAWLVDLDKRGDDRGFFARAFCEREFAEHGLVTRFVQMNNSLSGQRGTLRGLHYQLAPRGETKLVRCIRGALHDVILDLRRESPTFGKSFGADLSAENRRMMYVPKGFAHGFVTLTDGTEVLYLVDEFYSPELERGIRWDDPQFRIEWPIDPTSMSEKDRTHREFDPRWHLGVREPGASE